MGWFKKKSRPWVDEGNPYLENNAATGHDWSLFYPEKLVYVGPPELKPNVSSINKEEIARLDTRNMWLQTWIGIKPRLPTPNDYEWIEDTGFSSLLRGKLWLVNLPAGFDFFNCHANSIYPEKRQSLKSESAGNYGELFVASGYSEIPFKKKGKIPKDALIALFDGGQGGKHSARISNYEYDGIRLWESKLGTGGPRILHKLFDISVKGYRYGEVDTFYGIRAA